MKNFFIKDRLSICFSIFLLIVSFSPLLKSLHGFHISTSKINQAAIFDVGSSDDGYKRVAESLVPKIVLGNFEPITGNLEQMKYFYNALKKSKTTKVRIAHYGDSLILGDVISEYLRQDFQEKFSGDGVGYLSINSSDNRMRQSTLHTFSSDWTSVSIITRNPDQLTFGVSGSVAIPSVNSWVKYETTNFMRSSRTFSQANFFYSSADNSSTIEYSFDGKAAQKINLEPGSNVQELTLNNPSSKSFEMKFLSGKKPNMYGVSLEDGNGVYLDNFPMPGNTGVSLLELKEDILKQFDKYLNYKLIILTYGANVPPPPNGIYTLYINKMVSVIDLLKKAFPEASILIVSVADKTMKRGSRFLTNPEVPELLKAQKVIAQKSNVAFWDLWQAMGGENSMYKWVNAAPPMALMDYAHFTAEGGERVAELLFQALMKEYEKY